MGIITVIKRRIKMENSRIYTDLACERRRADTDIPGVEYNETESDGTVISTLKITSEEGAASIGKDIGEYVTLSFPNICGSNAETREKISEKLGEELKRLIKKNMPDKSEKPSILIVGLGNSEITADAIGPMTVSEITATRHMQKEKPDIFRMLDCSAVSAIATGVMAQTGYESSDIISSVTEKFPTDLIIAVDALVARSKDRLSTTIQIADTGINPGSGVGNHRSALNKDSMHIPVFSIGVPTVVSAATLIYDVINTENHEQDAETEKKLDEVKDFFVSPRECDTAVKYMSEIISEAINGNFGIKI